MLMMATWIQYLALLMWYFGMLCDATSGATTIKVGTYNLWNVMFNWNVRKYYIAELIRELDLDVIGFQEVRSDLDGVRTQLTELQTLLPDYQWSAYKAIQRVNLPKRAPRGWEWEGLGLLSRHPITHSSHQALSHQSRQDTNERLVLHTTINMGKIHVNVSVVHLSYDRWQQCVNVAEIMRYLRVIYSSCYVVNVCDGRPVLVRNLQDQQVNVGGNVEFVCTYMYESNDTSSLIDWYVSSPYFGLLYTHSGTTSKTAWSYPQRRSPHEHGMYSRLYTVNMTSNLWSAHWLITNVTIYDGNSTFRCVFDAGRERRLSRWASLTVIDQSPSSPAATTLSAKISVVPFTSSTKSTMVDNITTKTRQTVATGQGVPVGTRITQKPKIFTPDVTEVIAETLKQNTTVLIIGGASAAGFLVIVVICFMVLYVTSTNSNTSGQQKDADNIGHEVPLNHPSVSASEHTYMPYVRPVPGAEGTYSTYMESAPKHTYMPYVRPGAEGTNSTFTESASEHTYMPYVRPIPGAEGTNSTYMEFKIPTETQRPYETHIERVYETYIQSM